MSLSDDPTSPTKKNRARTRQVQRESPQDSSFLRPMETKMSPSDDPTSPTEKNRARTGQEPRESPQDFSFLSSKEPHETSRSLKSRHGSLKSRHGSFSKNPNYFGRSLDSAGNVGSQTYSGYANNGQSYLGVEPSNNSVGLRTSKQQQMSKSSVIGDNSSSVTDWRSSSRKRKDEEEEEEEQGDDKDEDASKLKKPRVVWSGELQKQFVAAVNQLGVEKAVPKKILELMNVPGLTRENVASHLQKYRKELRELGGVSQHQGSQDASFGRPAMVSSIVEERSIFSFDNSRTRFGEGLVHHWQQSQPQPQMNLLQGVPTDVQQQMSNSSAIGVDSDTLFAEDLQLQAYENYPRRLGLEGYGTNNEPTLMNVEGSNVSENYPRHLGLEGYLDSAGSKKPINTDEEVLKRYGSYRDSPNYYNDDNILLDTTNTLNPSGDMFEEFRPQEIMVIEVSQLSREGQVRAIQEWGLPESRLTHLVFCITPRSNMPGLDHHLTTLLNIRHSFLHLEYQQGWFDERTAIRLFIMDFARENHNDLKIGYLDSAGSKKPINTDEEVVLMRYESYWDNPNYYDDDNILLDTANTLNPSGDMFERSLDSAGSEKDPTLMNVEGSIDLARWNTMLEDKRKIEEIKMMPTPRSVNAPPEWIKDDVDPTIGQKSNLRERWKSYDST